MVLWMYPGYENSDDANKFRQKLTECGFEWEERVEELMDEPVFLDAEYEGLGIKNIESLKNYSLSDTGELLFYGMTEEEFEKKNGVNWVYDEDKAEDAYIEDINDSYDK